ncbi:hypothetical protein RHMOL_Rhmol01G0141700 [Rhododendron molle]|uniref:Uncharacterized protein n=1 Tax=Rhododendron molle TaxID=49168 RepID=A0ACC0Q410_RHOML|nr:hypothetical protein RHMOL_Rhmol01G0141700 [Rhododendron molle]
MPPTVALSQTQFHLSQLRSLLPLSLFSQSKFSIESDIALLHRQSTDQTNPALKFDLEEISTSRSSSPKTLTPCPSSKLEPVLSLKQTLDTLASDVVPKKRFSFKSKKDPSSVVNSTEPGKTEFHGSGKLSCTGWDLLGFKDRENEVLVREFEGLEMGEFSLTGLSSCEVRLTGCLRALFIHKLSDCKVYVGPVFGSVPIEEVEGCVFVLASHQIRIHHARRSDFYLRVRSRPIIEDCSGMRFAPYCWGYDGIDKDLQESNLDEEIGNWANVDDFRWLKAVQSPNWSILPESEWIGKVTIMNSNKVYGFHGRLLMLLMLSVCCYFFLFLWSAACCCNTILRAMSTTPRKLMCFCYLGGERMANADGSLGKYMGGVSEATVIEEGISFEELVVKVCARMDMSRDGKSLFYSTSRDKSKHLRMRDADGVSMMFCLNEDEVDIFVEEEILCNTPRQCNISSRCSFSACHWQLLSSMIYMIRSPVKYFIETFFFCKESNLLSSNPSSAVGEPPSTTKDSLTICHEMGLVPYSQRRGEDILSGDGQLFDNHRIFKKAVILFAALNKFTFKYLDNSCHYYRLACVVDGCPWKLTARAQGKSELIRVIKMRNEHCHTAQDNTNFKPRIRAKEIGMIFMDKLVGQPNFLPRSICKDYELVFHTPLTYSQGWRTRERARELISGPVSMTYHLVPASTQMQFINMHALHRH